MNKPRILVIKLGALGDFILAQAAFAAIRAHHPRAHITLLTTRPFMGLAVQSPYFDEIWCDEKPKLFQPLAWLKLRHHLKSGNFLRVYDLQTSARSAAYFRLFWPARPPEWSGIAKGCSHPDPTPVRSAVHAFDLRVAQLRAAGIAEIPLADLSWLTGEAERFALPGQVVLLAPGCAPHRPEKRWAVLAYAGLAARLAQQGFTPVIIGDHTETDLGRLIAAATPAAIDLTGQTSLFDLADLARRAVAAIGNDTGPMHLIAAIGCPAVVLFSKASDPAHSSPRGRAVTIVARDKLSDLTLEEVEAHLSLGMNAGLPRSNLKPAG